MEERDLAALRRQFLLTKPPTAPDDPDAIHATGRY